MPVTTILCVLYLSVKLLFISDMRILSLKFINGICTCNDIYLLPFQLSVYVIVLYRAKFVKIVCIHFVTAGGVLFSLTYSFTVICK